MSWRGRITICWVYRRVDVDGVDTAGLAWRAWRFPRYAPKEVFRRERVRALHPDVQRLAERKLVILDAAEKLPPITPGEILLEEFLKPLEVSQYQLAKDVGVPPRRINEIVLGKRAVTAGTALRLARYFGTSDRFWLNLQARHDLEAEKDRLGVRLRKEVRVLAEK